MQSTKKESSDPLFNGGAVMTGVIVGLGTDKIIDAINTNLNFEQLNPSTPE